MIKIELKYFSWLTIRTKNVDYTITWWNPFTKRMVLRYDVYNFNDMSKSFKKLIWGYKLPKESYEIN